MGSFMALAGLRARGTLALRRPPVRKKPQGDRPRALAAAGVFNDTVQVVAVARGDFRARAADFFYDRVIHVDLLPPSPRLLRKRSRAGGRARES